MSLNPFVFKVLAESICHILDVSSVVPIKEIQHAMHHHIATIITKRSMVKAANEPNWSKAKESTNSVYLTFDIWMFSLTTFDMQMLSHMTFNIRLLSHTTFGCWHDIQHLNVELQDIQHSTYSLFLIPATNIHAGLVVSCHHCCTTITGVLLSSVKFHQFILSSAQFWRYFVLQSFCQNDIYKQCRPDQCLHGLPFC